MGTEWKVIQESLQAINYRAISCIRKLSFLCTSFIPFHSKQTEGSRRMPQDRPPLLRSFKFPCHKDLFRLHRILLPVLLLPRLLARNLLVAYKMPYCNLGLLNAPISDFVLRCLWCKQFIQHILILFLT